MAAALAPAWGTVRPTLARLSPNARRYQRFLSELPLDPDRLPSRLPDAGALDYVMCGCPRTGTTLLAAALHQPPAAITVMEPWDGMRMPPHALFTSLREEIASTGELRRGRLDLDALEADGEVAWCQEGAVVRRLTRPSRSCWASSGPPGGGSRPHARDEVPGLPPASRRGRRVLPGRGGRVAQGLQYDTAFNRTLNRELGQIRDVEERRVRLFEYVHTRLLPLLERPNVLAVRYERWALDADGLLAEIGEFLGHAFGSAAGPHPARPRAPPESKRARAPRPALLDGCRAGLSAGGECGSSTSSTGSATAVRSARSPSSFRISTRPASIRRCGPPPARAWRRARPARSRVRRAVRGVGAPRPVAWLQLRRVARERAPDVVHTCLFSANLAGRLAVAGRVPVLTSLVEHLLRPRAPARPERARECTGARSAPSTWRRGA